MYSKFSRPELFEDVILDLPTFVVNMDKQKRQFTADEVVEQTSKMWAVDHYPVSLKGTNHNAGVQRLTSTKQKGPRRLNLFDSLNNK